MSPGDKVFLFTASGTFRGHSGRVVRLTRDGAELHVEGAPWPMRFTAGEIVTERESARDVGGAE